MKKFIIDRIEEERAVLECEDGGSAELEVKSLPKNIKEGDVLYFEEGSYFLDKQETEHRRQKIKNLMDSLFE